MANTAVISRSNLIYGVCLPLAVLIGYLLAEPFELGSIAVVALIFGVLSIPLVMRWHHLLLLVSCNAAICPYFLPGRPMLWMLAAILSFGIIILTRAMGKDVQFFRARNVSRSLIFLALVVIITALMTGGIGFSSLGGKNVGSKRYVYVVAAILAYFGFSTLTIPRKWAGLAVAAFFLSSYTGLLSYLVAFAGPKLYFMVELLPVEGAIEELNSNGLDITGTQFVRYGGLMGVAFGTFFFLFARYGVRGLFDLSRPWRLLLLLVTIVASVFSGFRSAIILPAIIFILLFYTEGLCRTRLFPALLLTGTLIFAVMLPFVSKLPYPVQRTLAFLPVNIDPIVRRNAEDSSDWRVEMWKEVIPTIPKYLIKGKGYAINSAELALMQQAEQYGLSPGMTSYEASMLAGDYHSGPLSVIIPFGLFGVAGFFWFLWASLQVLRRNYLFGDASLKRINAFLMVCFVARVLFYLFVFGSLYSDLINFTSLVGLSLAVNGGVCQAPQPAEEIETE